MGLPPGKESSWSTGGLSLHSGLGVPSPTGYYASSGSRDSPWGGCSGSLEERQKKVGKTLSQLGLSPRPLLVWSLGWGRSLLAGAVSVSRASLPSLCVNYGSHAVCRPSSGDTVG